MNLKEIKSYIKNYYTNYINEQVDYYYKIYHFNMNYKGKYRSYNNEGDAFKHTFMQADLTLKFNEEISKFIGDDHEKKPNNDPNEKNMDLWNNQQGREIGIKIKNKYKIISVTKPSLFKSLAFIGFFDDEIAKEVINKMRNNQLITDPNNPKGKYYKEENNKETKNYQQEVLKQKILNTYADFQNQKIKDYFENILHKYYINRYAPYIQNIEPQVQKPLNMNFAELIKPKQTSTVSYEPFYSERNTFVNNTSNINYGNKKFSANNTIKMQNEKNPALYKGTASKPGVIPNNASGYSLLNTAKASLIPQIEYVLPKFNSPKVELDTSPISRSNINPIAQNDFVSNLNNLNIANNSGQDDDIFSLLINAIKKKNS